MQKVLVKNAADEAQVKAAENRILSGRDQELRDILTVLETVSGRRFMWRLLGHCKTFQSIWEASARIHYLAGIQDVGHFILSEITEADEGMLLKMMQENQKEKK